MHLQHEDIRFGVHSGQQYTSFYDLLHFWQQAEELGFDWISVFDHLRPTLGKPDGPCFEGTTILAALAASTRRVRCAMLVSPVTWRHPAVIAAAAATIDHVSGGRLEYGLGAGGIDRAYSQYGITYPGTRARIEMLDEACQIVRGLWRDEVTSFAGTHYQLADARLSPKPLQAHLPLIIGAEGERRMLGIVAKHADIWNTIVCDPPEYQRKLTALDRHCAAIGRNPADIRKSLTFRALLREGVEEAQSCAAKFRRSAQPGAPVVAEYLTFGTPSQCIKDLMRYVHLGVRDFIFGVRPPIDWPSVELVARVVAPRLKEMANSRSTYASEDFG